jgi:hypothetical protein
LLVEEEMEEGVDDLNGLLSSSSSSEITARRRRLGIANDGIPDDDA